ncbi:histone-like nucleoid-structuring protein Lsr2 [Microlunatus speluncae]|uniref:histone-like nucleoid-structuring protein Lsr2 n=1 Tax=Microlunatus speluncae TaxID=2594267 RepID=UPI00126662B9|nr:Lsr2 family protein [Microlunatus speluncae]
MAQKVITMFEDDLDGKAIKSGQGGTVTFSLDGVEYEIDLSNKNKEALDKALSPYLKVARRVGGRRRRGSRNPAPARVDPSQSRAIREWAADNGYQVSSRGRIPAEVTEAYNASA